jgi:predicted phage terminase large subunit-like protein
VSWQPPEPLFKLQQRVSELMLDGQRDYADALMREACLAPPYGLWVLLRYGLGRADAHNQWVFDRCLEVQASPDGHLDLWAREHYKSTIITFALSIQDILRNPETTIGIFSHTRPIAKAFLRQIKQEFERNDRLKRWFSDVLWDAPAKESPKWSEDEGITVKRKGNPKEATVEAWGLVDGQPTSKHFDVLDYDDIVVESSVGTPEMIKKTTDALANSYNLGKRGGKRRFVGTRYHYNDTYREIMERGTVTPRLYPATADGTVDGPPVFLSASELTDKRRDMGPYVFGCQMLQDPTADDKQGFRVEWLKYAAVTSRGHNLMILVDPASKKRATSDYTSMWLLGLGPDRKVYVHDMVRDRLSLTQRADTLIKWHRYWSAKGPIQAVAYEEYGLQADIEHAQSRMEDENYRFEITPVGGRLNKLDRIRRLIPWFEQGRIYLPPSMVKTNYEGKSVDLVQAFKVEEYLAFPVAPHDDMLDALARFLDDDLAISFPLPIAEDDDRELESVGGRNQTTGY